MGARESLDSELPDLATAKKLAAKRYTSAEEGFWPGALAHLLDEHAEEDPLVDLVVFDEAHYMRNPESSVHRLGEMLQKVSQQRVLLSATPINLHNDDLFHLLQLCDPEHFQYPSSFQELLLANQPLVSARDAALNPSSSAEEILTYVKGAAETDLLRNSRQLATLLEAPPTDKDLAPTGVSS